MQLNQICRFRRMSSQFRSRGPKAFHPCSLTINRNMFNQLVLTTKERATSWTPLLSQIMLTCSRCTWRPKMNWIISNLANSTSWAWLKCLPISRNQIWICLLLTIPTISILLVSSRHQQWLPYLSNSFRFLECNRSLKMPTPASLSFPLLQPKTITTRVLRKWCHHLMIFTSRSLCLKNIILMQWVIIAN